jgi:PD-(D/E)XK nuclease superfamily
MPTIIYKDKNGKRLPSVTTVNRIGQDPGGLIHWAWALGIDGVDYRQARDDAGEAGTLGHALVDAAIHQKAAIDLAPYDEETRQAAKNAFAAYQEWRKQNKLEIIASEEPLVSERWRYGGCLDAVAKQNGKFVLCDWKTGQLYPDHLCQAAAYRQLWNEHKPDKKIAGAHLVRFNKDTGNYIHAYIADLTTAWQAFRLKLELYYLLAQLKKQV